MNFMFVFFFFVCLGSLSVVQQSFFNVIMIIEFLYIIVVFFFLFMFTFDFFFFLFLIMFSASESVLGLSFYITCGKFFFLNSGNVSVVF